jgi:citrate lyase beta subunit
VLDADTVIMDLEDGVALNRKTEARQTVASALQTLDFGARERIVRVNALETGLVQDEISATAPGRPDAYLAPKVEDASDLHALDRMLSQAEETNGLPRNRFRLLAMIETALGVMNLRAICRATPRLDALIFGAEDLAASTGAIRTQRRLGGLLCPQCGRHGSRRLWTTGGRLRVCEFQRRRRLCSGLQFCSPTGLCRQNLDPPQPDRLQPIASLRRRRRKWSGRSG